MDDIRTDVMVAPRRRRDDLVDSGAMLGMVRYLMNRPTCDQIAEHLVLNLLSRDQVRASVITLFGMDGSLHLVGSFGIPIDHLDRYRRASLWDRTPMGDAVRGGQPIVVDTPGELAERYPGLVGASDELVAAWPLSLPDQRVGALQVTMSVGADTERLREDLHGLAAVLALYLSLLSGAPDPAPDPPPVAHASSAPPIDRLSDRQSEILDLMSRGLTNPQISHRIGFSESTVRQESMAIYRYLGVGGRRDAVNVARARGLLQDS